MPTMRSVLFCSDRARRGFTLFELMIAMSLGLFVVGAALYAYFGANKAQAVSVGSNMLKICGQASVGDIYMNLNQARVIFDRDAVTPTYLSLLPIQGYAGTLSPGVVTSEIKLPLAKSAGSFSLQVDDGTGVPGGQAAAAANPDFDVSSVGNALFFLAKDRTVSIRDNSASTLQTNAFKTADFMVHAFRFQFYYLAQRALPLNAMRIRPDVGWTYQLMHWDSLPYLDLGELKDWMKGCMDTGDSNADTYIDGKLAALAAQYPGAVDLAASDAAAAFYDLASSDHVSLTAKPANTPITSGHFSTAMKSQMRTTFGETFVAFNTETDVNNVVPAVTIPSLDQNAMRDRVPAYASSNGTPYGFEVMVAGPPASRKVLVHLTVAARTQPGNTLMAESFQKLAQCYQY